MKTKTNKNLLILSVCWYVIFIALMVIGTVNDVAVGKAVFNPESSLARLAENFGQFVYWGMWGPAFTVILLREHDLNEICGICKIKTDPDSKAFKTLNTIVKIIYKIAFFVLAVVGWKKLIENVTKNILQNAGQENLNQAVYFIISAAVAVIGILFFRKINKDALKKLELAAFSGVALGICYKIIEELKPLTERVRFREMVAYSNGFLNEKGLSEGKYSPLTSEMANTTDFSAFTPWYKKGDAMGIYSRADSFPSGHTTYSCTLLLSYIFCRLFDKLKKAAPFMLAVSFVYVALMGYMRMVAGAHYLTDVAAAAIIGYTVFLIINALYNKINN